MAKSKSSKFLGQAGFLDLIGENLVKDPLVRDFYSDLGKKTLQVVGLSETAELALLAPALRNLGRPALLLVADELKARQYQAIWQALSDLPAYILPAKELVFTDVLAASRELELQSLAILSQWLRGQPCLVIAPARAMLDPYPKGEFFREKCREFAVGKDYDLARLQADLNELGYERVNQIEVAGQYAVRGDLLDIGLAEAGRSSAARGIRLSFFDTELEDIREFDIDSQRSVGRLDTILLYPAKEWLLDPAKSQALADQIEAAGQAQSQATLRQAASVEEAEKFSLLGKRDADRLREGLAFAAMDRWLYLLKEDQASLLGLAKASGSLLLLAELDQIQKRQAAGRADFYQKLESCLARGQVVKDTEGVCLTEEEAWQGLSDLKPVTFAMLDVASSGVSGSSKLNFQARAADFYQSRENALVRDWHEWTKEGQTVLLFAGSESRQAKLDELKFRENLTGHVSPLNLSRGFVWPKAGLVLLGTEDIFLASRAKSKRKKQGISIDFLSDLKVGDYVVHEDHGIGIYHGLKTLDVGDKVGDYLHISYAGTDQLYISVDQVDKIQKYVSAGGGKPKLSKLDGQSWQKLKTRARESIKQLATDLIKLYSERMKTKGYPFAPDTVWQEEFEEGFPYVETEDQLAAVADLKRDMESDKVMDRLLCGDVGFGKTEVAFRGLFKAAIEGKQAAMLVPTTVLAQQHYENLAARLEKFPIRLALLSRFVPAAERKKIIKELERGEVDIVIGTHRVLSKDINFKDLGLLVVDEEQRFGVDHKEKIKARYPTVDVLSMTATPIPRTLHMSISGIRDISILEEGPADRRPVQTYVMEFDQGLVEEAILKEVGRHGQVFYLFNNTHKIAEKTAQLRRDLPGLKVEYGHGQMSERQLENVVESFIAGEFDVLVCTTIIESGVDMPNVNTIIVENADRLGLAQLYQIRGRVGRSERQAYAYITYNPARVLNEDAAKRLAAIRDYTELGSGFKIALRDLEVRGAGNLLGADQHGHMEAIGYELYCKMLAENMEELTDRVVPDQPADCQVELAVDARIPASYISDEGLRLDLYKRIAQIKNESDHYDLVDELIDRFGEPPRQVLNLCAIALIRSRGSLLGVDRIYLSGDDVFLTFDQNKPNMEALADLLAKDRAKGRVLFNAGVKPYLLISKIGRAGNRMIEELVRILL